MGESQSNGEVEQAVKAVQGEARTIRDALETRIGRRLDHNHHALPWLIRHAADCISRRQVGRDGKTPIERLRGRAIHRPTFEVGEKLLYLPLKAARPGDYRNRFSGGHLFGLS